MQARRSIVLSVLVMIGMVLASPAPAQRAVQKGEACQQTCPKSSCSKTCRAGTECVSYCSPNDYAICKCVKIDKKRPR